jgi:hypothetical protein
MFVAAEIGRLAHAETEVFAPAVVKAREMVKVGGWEGAMGTLARIACGPHSPLWDVDQTGGGALGIVWKRRVISLARMTVVEVMAWGAPWSQGSNQG